MMRVIHMRKKFRSNARIVLSNANVKQASIKVLIDQAQASVFGTSSVTC